VSAGVGGLVAKLLLRPLLVPSAAIARGVARTARLVIRPTAAMLTSVAIFVVAAFVSRAVYRSTHFSVRALVVDTHGATHVTEASVRKTLATALGAPIFGVSTTALAGRLGRNPWVQQVTVRRQLPSSLVVELRERPPVALVLLGALYLVDPTGVPFKRAALDETEGLAVITGIERHTYRYHPDVGARLVHEALEVLAAYDAVPGRPRLAELRMDEAQGVSLFTYQGGTEVRLGRERYQSKLARFDALRQSLRHGPMALRAVYLDDDRWTDRVVIRPADGEDPSSLLVDRTPLRSLAPGLLPPGRAPGGLDDRTGGYGTDRGGHNPHGPAPSPSTGTPTPEAPDGPSPSVEL
jgi:cell division septal protein FtsQ